MSICSRSAPALVAHVNVAGFLKGVRPPAALQHLWKVLFNCFYCQWEMFLSSSLLSGVFLEDRLDNSALQVKPNPDVGPREQNSLICHVDERVDLIGCWAQRSILSLFAPTACKDRKWRDVDDCLMADSGLQMDLVVLPLEDSCH